METIYCVISNISNTDNIDRYILGYKIADEINQIIRYGAIKFANLNLLPVLLIISFLIILMESLKNKLTTNTNNNYNTLNATKSITNNTNATNATNPTNDTSDASDTSDTSDSDIEDIEPIIINKGLCLESVKELNTSSKDMIHTFIKEQTYYALIRAKMQDYIKMAGTKFELHGNNIHPETVNTNEEFKTKDTYLILKFKIVNDIKENVLIGNLVNQLMNELNYGEFIVKDFIICVIGTSPNVDQNEFNNGLKYIGYELENNLLINKKIPNSKIIINYSLLLPIHQVYDLFMDVYNICNFESAQYVIDNENYESWNGKSINELPF